MHQLKNCIKFFACPITFTFLYSLILKVLENQSRATFIVTPLYLFGPIALILYGLLIGLLMGTERTGGRLLWQSLYLIASIGIILFGLLSGILHPYLDVYAGIPILAITAGLYLYDMSRTVQHRGK